MGLFDRVEVPCPECGAKNDFQSKGGDCSMHCYTLENAPDDVMSDVNRHAPISCRHCETPYLVVNRKAVTVASQRPLVTIDEEELAILKEGWDTLTAYAVDAKIKPKDAVKISAVIELLLRLEQDTRRQKR